MVGRSEMSGRGLSYYCPSIPPSLVAVGDNTAANDRHNGGSDTVPRETAPASYNAHLTRV